MSWERELDYLDRNVADLRTAVEDHISALERTVDDLATALEEMKKERDDLAWQVDNLKDEISSFETRIIELNG